MDAQHAELNTAPQLFHLMRGATENVFVDYGESASGSKPTGVLNPGEVLTGSVTIAVRSKPNGASDVTISNEAVNSATLYCNGRSVSAGEGIQFKVVASSTQTKGIYELLITCSTDSSPARVLKKIIRILVVEY